MNAGVRLALAGLLIGGVVVLFTTLSRPEAKAPPANGTDGQPAWESSQQCKQCHEEIWAEWMGSHHQIAYLNPEVRKLSDDFKNKECQACHLPRPVFETGIGNRPLQRIARPNEGIDCLSCHLSAEGKILGRSSRPDVPCRPVANEDLPTVAMCEVCHNQHWTTDQWRASDYAKRDVGCNDCHMPEVERKSGSKGRHHGFAGSHDLTMLQKAATFTATKEGKDLVLSLTNDGCGHSFPTEERSRAVDMVYRFHGADGPLGEEFERAFRFRMPYRDEPGEDTQLPAGAKKAVRIPIPDGATKAVARLWFRLEPYIGDDNPRSTMLFEREVDL